MIDQNWFIVRGRLEIPVRDHKEPLSQGVWCSLSQDNIQRYEELLEQVTRETGESFFGWVCSAIRGLGVQRDTWLSEYSATEDHGACPTSPKSAVSSSWSPQAIP